MPQGKRDYRVLDKDLGSITNVERAQFHAFRPILRLGAAVLILAGVLLLFTVPAGQQTELVGIAAGLIVAGWLGLAIGANDVANSLGTAVAAGAVRLMPGLMLVAAAEVAGATFAGDAVTHRLAAGIFDTAQLGSPLQAQLVMLSALIAAASWITFATAMSLPVSTSHSIVGAISGAGIAALGFSAIYWKSLLHIALTWVATPLVSAVLAGAILIFIQMKLAEADDRRTAARLWLPLLVGGMVGLFVAYVMILVWDAPMPALVLGAGLGSGFLAGWFMRRRVVGELAAAGQGKPAMKHLFRPPLLFAAVMMAFAHGASDAGNVAGPLAVILSAARADSALQVPILLLMGAGASIAIGAVLFGRRLVIMVGSGITRLNAVRAFCITLATALITIVAAGAGLPTSSTHVAIGGIFGVGFVREWLDRRPNRRTIRLPAEEKRRRQLIRRSHVFTISAAWVITVPLTAALGGLLFVLLRAILAP